MTDKEKIREEVERIFKENRERCSREGYAAVEQLRKVLAFIDSLQEEPVSNDLEEAVNKHLVEKGYLLTTKNGEHLAEVEAKGLFKAGAKWQKIKTCEWLKEHKEHPLIGCEDPCLSGYLTDEFIEDFKKAMEK